MIPPMLIGLGVNILFITLVYLFRRCLSLELRSILRRWYQGILCARLGYEKLMCKADFFYSMFNDRFSIHQWFLSCFIVYIEGAHFWPCFFNSKFFSSYRIHHHNLRHSRQQKWSVIYSLLFKSIFAMI